MYYSPTSSNCTLECYEEILNSRFALEHRYNKFVIELIWKTIKEGEESQSIRAVRVLGDLCQVLFLDDPNGTGRCIVDIRNSLSSLLNENDTTIVRSRTWCGEIRYVLKNLWPRDLDDFFVHVLRSELKLS